MSHHISAVTEVGCPDGALGVDLADLLPGLDVPEPHRVVRGPGDEVCGVPLGVQTPHGATVAVVGAESLPVDGVPHVGVVVLGRAEQKVSLSVVLDLSDIRASHRLRLVQDVIFVLAVESGEFLSILKVEVGLYSV